MVVGSEIVFETQYYACRVEETGNQLLSGIGYNLLGGSVRVDLLLQKRSGTCSFCETSKWDAPRHSDEPADFDQNEGIFRRGFSERAE